MWKVGQNEQEIRFLENTLAMAWETIATRRMLAYLDEKHVRLEEELGSFAAKLLKLSVANFARVAAVVVRELLPEMIQLALGQGISVLLQPPDDLLGDWGNWYAFPCRVCTC